MNKAMMMMKPIRLSADSTKADIREAQDARVLEWLDGIDYSVNARDVTLECRDIPGVVDISPSRACAPKWRVRQCSVILQRLERKGLIVSALHGRYRYYSTPVVKGGEM